MSHHHETVDRSKNLLEAYLSKSALCKTANETFNLYLGTSSNSKRNSHVYKAFLEDLEAEYISKGHHRLNRKEATQLGVYRLLDGMPVDLKQVAYSLSDVLDQEAFKNDKHDTYYFYLSDERKHTRDEELEFKEKLFYLYSIFRHPLNEQMVHAVVKYMRHNDPSYNEHDSEDIEEDEETAEEDESEEDDEDHENVLDNLDDSEEDDEDDMDDEDEEDDMDDEDDEDDDEEDEDEEDEDDDEDGRESDRELNTKSPNDLKHKSNPSTQKSKYN